MSLIDLRPNKINPNQHFQFQAYYLLLRLPGAGRGLGLPAVGDPTVGLEVHGSGPRLHLQQSIVDSG